jgi:Secretion system C-terminal sorting domain
MKKALIVLFLCSITISMFAEDFMLPSPAKGEVRADEFFPRVPTSNREAPNYEFFTDPTALVTSYYDYMPGSYNSLPIRLQQDAQGGMYIVFHGTETAASTRREYYAYVDGTGNVNAVATVTSSDIREGYGGIDIDPVTGDPFVAYHIKFGDPAGAEVLGTYDLYHLGSPGLWKTPWIVMDRSVPTPFADDDFVWPYVHIGPSPDPDKRRVFVFGNNLTSHQTSTNPSENTLIGYADFNANDLNAQSELDWTYNTIPTLDGWNAGDPEEIRPFSSYAVSDDGKVAIMGYNSNDEVYVFLNDNYGEGDYEYFTSAMDYDVPNPQNQDGTYRFLDENGQPHDMYMAPQNCNHMNAIFTNDKTKLRFLGAMNLLIRPDLWYPDLSLNYTKVFTFDMMTEEFSFYDLAMEGANPSDDIPMVPWDLNEDGVVDEFDPDGFVTWESGWPIYFQDTDAAFHENSTKMAANDEYGIVAAVWVDGLNNRLAQQGEPGYTGWEEYAEIAIAISTDHGETWGEPLYMNSKNGDDNFASELDGMKAAYIYPGDKIEVLENGPGTADDQALIHLFFYDDNSFGSTVQGFGQNLGGQTMYASVLLSDFTSTPNNTIPQISVLSQNYPNPFNPETTINFSLKNTGHVTIEIFNSKGQKVKTLLNRELNGGENDVVWYGTDDAGMAVSSGIYFYRLKTEGVSETKKMLLLK